MGCFPAVLLRAVGNVDEGLRKGAKAKRALKVLHQEEWVLERCKQASCARKLIIPGGGWTAAGY